MVGREPSKEEKYEIIKNYIKENGEDGKKIVYKALQILCEEDFEGVRLTLKSMKQDGILDFDGMIPGFASVIELK